MENRDENEYARNPYQLSENWLCSDHSGMFISLKTGGRFRPPMFVWVRTRSMKIVVTVMVRVRVG